MPHCHSRKTSSPFPTWYLLDDLAQRCLHSRAESLPSPCTQSGQQASYSEVKRSLSARVALQHSCNITAKPKLKFEKISPLYSLYTSFALHPYVSLCLPNRHGGTRSSKCFYTLFCIFRAPKGLSSTFFAVSAYVPPSDCPAI